MNTSLYLIASEYQALANTLQENDFDEVTIHDTLEGADGELETKAINVGCFIRNLESSAYQIKLAEKAMAKRRKSIENKADSIRKYLFDNMKACGISKIESPYFALTIKKNPSSLVIEDESLIPSDYFIQPETPPLKLDNALVKKALTDGYDVPGARLNQAERLEIK
jgi:hypothetical protein